MFYPTTTDDNRPHHTAANFLRKIEKKSVATRSTGKRRFGPGNASGVREA